MSVTRFCLIGIDGLRVGDALAGQAPALAALVATGEVAEAVMEVPTMSGPGWTSLLTGTRHSEHRVFGNGFEDHRIAPRSDLLSRVAEAVPGTRTLAVASWPPLVDAASPGPVLDPREDDQRAGTHRVVLHDGEPHDYRRADVAVARDAREALAGGDVDAAFVYLGYVDEVGHTHGGVSSEYAEAVRLVDGHLGELVGAVAARAEQAGEPWVVAVTTDHGHLDEGGHGDAEEVVRRSFVAVHRYGPGSDEPLGLPARMEPWELTPWLVALRDGTSSAG